MSDTAYRVQVLDRAFALLDALAISDHPLGPTELGERSGLNKSTVHRLLAVLEHNRYVERDHENGRYRLGLKLVELGSVALSRVDLHARARSFVERLMAETGETAHLGVLRQNEVISLVNAESQRSVRTPSTVGRRSPLHCTSQGKALLALHPPAEIDRLLRDYRFTVFTRKTIRNAQQFRLELSKVRSNGFAVDDEEFEDGLRCIGAPVRDHSGKVVAAVSIAGPSFRVSPERLPALIRSVLNVAADLSAALGFVANEAVTTAAAARAGMSGAITAIERARRRV